MPEHNYSLIRKLANTALRLNKVLVCAMFLNLLTLAAFGWALSRLVTLERNKVSVHFNRLVSEIRQHEEFLLRVAEHGNSVAPIKTENGAVTSHRLLVDERGRRIYEGAAYSFSMPFTLSQQHARAEPHPRNFYLGALLASFYGNFWSTSAYPSPQVFIIGARGNTSMAVPAIGKIGVVTLESYFSVVHSIFNALPAKAGPMSKMEVRWAPARHYSGAAQKELLGYLYFTMPDALWWVPKIKRQLIAVSLLELNQVGNVTYGMQSLTYDRLQLVSPRGNSLGDQIGSVDGYHKGLNFAPLGLIFKMEDAGSGGWVALYEVTYQSFFGYAKWQVLGGFLLFLATLVGGWVATRWYARKVISPARRAHLEIVESDTFSRTVIQIAPVALCVLRRTDRQLIMHNPLAEKLLGDASDVARLSESWNINHDPAVPETDVIFDSVGSTTLHGSFASARYQGEDVVLCTFNDISAHRQAEKKLAEAKRSADAASAAKSRFLATMSHEIRTPLYGALGTLELLGLTNLDRQQRIYHQTIERSSLILLQLVSDVLDVSKIEAGEMALAYTEFSPVDLAEDVVRQFYGLAQGKFLSLQLCLDPGIPGAVKGDALRIRQIITNLLSNALKFTEQGSVTLMVGAQLDDGYVTLNWQVIDTGIGIAASEQAHLFEPFYQAHRVEHTISGTGLGLSICAYLTQLMGGRIEVASEVAVGSRFTFSLKLEVVQAEIPARGQRPPQQRLGELGLSILVVEDNPINQALLSHQLEELGCRVTLASNGVEALQRWSAGFDAVLTDVNMPTMDGYQLVQELRRRGANQPIVVISASTVQEKSRRLVEDWVSAWLVKPMSLRDLYEVLRNWCPRANRVEIVQPEKFAQLRVEEVVLKSSPRMLKLFLTTMDEDIQKLQDACERQDVNTVTQQLHRIRGALAAVNARHLVHSCEQLEHQLLESSSDLQWPLALAELVKNLECLLLRVRNADGQSHDSRHGIPRALSDTGSENDE
ncbi:ATP-binding protein [Pseudomonas sp. NPDC087803]|uniref:ATP-binding protein n=1 Tax=Pseudomonas sp. NPDC087803 TaxID=3364448 RepID=UPI0038058A46